MLTRHAAGDSPGDEPLKTAVCEAVIAWCIDEYFRAACATLADGPSGIYATS